MAKHKREEWCRHFNGIQNTCCKAGVAYEQLNVRGKAGLPCLQDENAEPCKLFELRTAEEIAAMQAERERLMDCMKRQVSECCEAEYDKSQVIKEGKYKGHGRYHCSKCGKLLFMV